MSGIHEVRIECRSGGLLEIYRGYQPAGDPGKFIPGSWTAKAPDHTVRSVCIAGDGGYLRLAAADVPEFVKALKAVAS